MSSMAMAKSSASASSSSNNTNVEKRRRRVATAEDEDEEDKTARALLTEEGFDPNDLKKRNEYGWTPMSYFSATGNVTMCRYLIAHGADCRNDKFGTFPMIFASMFGHLEVMELLSQVGGAHEDIRKRNRNGLSPLRAALWNGHTDAVKWLILNKALSSSRDDVAGGVIDDATMRRDLNQEVGDNWQDDRRLRLLSWARDAVTAHGNVKLLLKGTIVCASSYRRHPNNPYATRSKRTKVSTSSSPMVMLKGKSGILELIAHYVAGTPQQLRTLWQLIDRLPAFIADVPFFVEEEEEDDDEDDY